MRSRLLCLLAFVAFTATAQTGFRIQIKLSNYKSDTLLLGYHLGDKQYVRDTAFRTAGGDFVFSADTLLPCGMYLGIMRPDNQYFQIILSDEDQKMQIEANALDPYNGAKAAGAVDNKAFFDYMGYLAVQRQKANPWSAILGDSTKSKVEKDAATAELEKINVAVKAEQERIILKFPSTLTTAIIKSSIDVIIPEMKDWKDSTELQQMRYDFYRGHYFDNINYADPCLLRTPLLQPKVSNYMEKVIPQHPDTLSREIDVILNKMGLGSELFQYYVTTFLNYYAKPKYVGFDGVYVHLALTYYKDPKITPWVHDTVRAKIVKNALEMQPTLIGNKAPDLRMFKKDSTVINLYDVKSDFTVLLIWAPTCGHCKKSMPDFTKAYAKYKSKGVEIFAVCSMSPTETQQCWDFIDKNDSMNWVNVVDPYNLSRYRQLYDVKTTPRVFILDRDKIIRSKQMEAEQLDNVLEQLILEDERKRLKGGK
jgi:peroxiredoxin